MPAELWINNVTESKWENGLNIGIAIANNEKNYKTCLVILHGHITNRPSDLCHFKIQQKKKKQKTTNLSKSLHSENFFEIFVHNTAQNIPCRWL